MLELNIATMTCGHCASVVTKTVKQADAQAKVEIDLRAHKVRIESTQDRDTLEAALTEAGYKPD